MTLNKGDLKRGFTYSLPAPVVLVVGDFRKNSIGFARKAWNRINHAYRREGESFGPARGSAQSAEPENYEQNPIVVAKYTEYKLSPALFPIAINDYGRASSAHFRFYLYQVMKRFNVVGIVSCCTASNNKGLAEAIRPIDVPVLLVLDSTLSAPNHFGGNVLQLIANNSLQAQAILAQARILSDRSRQQTVRLFCYPDDDEYVRDLKRSIESNLENSEKSNLDARMVNDPRELSVRENRTTLICVGYYAALRRIGSELENCDLILSDGFDDPRVKKRLAGVVPLYFLVRPVHKAIDHAVDAYRVLNEEWRKSINLNCDDPAHRLRDSINSIREILQAGQYRFVGPTNQRGGYFVEEIAP
jgi:hypothetical protein